MGCPLCSPAESRRAERKQAFYAEAPACQLVTRRGHNLFVGNRHVFQKTQITIGPFCRQDSGQICRLSVRAGESATSCSTKLCQNGRELRKHPFQVRLPLLKERHGNGILAGSAHHASSQSHVSQRVTTNGGAAQGNDSHGNTAHRDNSDGHSTVRDHPAGHATKGQGETERATTQAEQAQGNSPDCDDSPSNSADRDNSRRDVPTAKIPRA